MTVPDPAATAESGRDAAGKFTTGAGNRGRPVGAKSRFNKAVLDALGGLTSQAMAVLKAKLDENDLKAATFILVRYLPDSRVVEIPSTDSAAWMDALADGTITPGEAQKASAALKTFVDSDEVRLLRDRLDELEAILLKPRDK